jgi:hypothetical protein
MARRPVRITPVGLLGSVLMVVSPFLPSAAPPLDAALLASRVILWLPIAVWTLGLYLASPKQAWLPALGWVVILAWDFDRVWSMSKGRLSPWGWLAAATGGGCVLVASLRERRRTRPQTDVSAFE